MSWEAYVQMCVEHGIRPTKAGWRKHNETKLRDIRHWMREDAKEQAAAERRRKRVKR